MRPDPIPARRRAAGWVAATLAAAMLAGCAVAPAPSAPAAAVRRTPLTAFELSGRLSATDGERAASGRLEWVHTVTGDSWTAFSPLGQIVARLERDALGAHLVTADGRRVDAADADTLLPQVLGVEAPLAHLARWVQAAPRSGAEVRRTDADGRPAVVIDDGWLIEYAEYAAEGAQALPRRIDVQRGDTRLRLFVDQWTPPALAAVRPTPHP